MTKISEKKKKEVEEIKKLINEYNVFGIVDMENLPSLQLQRIKQQVKGKILVKMSKKRLIKIAVEQLKDDKKNIEQVKDKMVGMPALIFTNDDPLKLGKFLRKNTSPAPAKTGQIAPNDIIVKSGLTSFTPGPIIGELGQFGIKTSVESGKIAIKEDKVLVKDGEKISSKAADILSKLKIEPMKVGLNLVLTYKDGEILTRDVLSINEEEYIMNINLASREALNLAVSVGYLSNDTTYMILAKAYREAMALESKIGGKLDNAVSEESVKKEVIEEVKEEKAEEIKEETFKEEVAEEPKSEEPKEEIKLEQPKVEEIKEETFKEEKATDEPKSEEPKEEIKVEQPKVEEIKEEISEEERKKLKSLSTKELIDEIKREDDFKIEIKEKTDFDRDEEIAQKILQEATDKKIKQEREKKRRVPSASDLAKKR